MTAPHLAHLRDRESADVLEGGAWRHGTISGYKYHGCRCDDCKAACSRYEKRRKWLVHQGIAPTLPARGFQRRVHALMAIGWTQLDIARRLGIAQGNLAAKMRLNDTVRRATHVAMCDLYEELCMSPQAGAVNQRTARIAAKNGWAPPLAWDDIDTDERPKGIRDTDSSQPAALVVEEYAHACDHSPGESRKARIRRLAPRLGMTPEAMERALLRAQKRQESAA